MNSDGMDHWEKSMLTPGTVGVGVGTTYSNMQPGGRPCILARRGKIFDKPWGEGGIKRGLQPGEGEFTDLDQPESKKAIPLQRIQVN